MTAARSIPVSKPSNMSSVTALSTSGPASTIAEPKTEQTIAPINAGTYFFACRASLDKDFRRSFGLSPTPRRCGGPPPGPKAPGGGRLFWPIS
jgi:hypothetical protein